MVELRSPVPGILSMLHAEEGAIVEAGDNVCAVESMKTFYDLETPIRGTVRYRTALGDLVGENDVVVVIEPGA